MKCACRRLIEQRYGAAIQHEPNCPNAPVIVDIVTGKGVAYLEYRDSPAFDPSPIATFSAGWDACERSKTAAATSDN